MPDIHLTSTAICHQPVDKVWELVTDATALHALHIPYVYETFDVASAGVGTTFRGCSPIGGGGWDMHISEWIPKRRFAFGETLGDATFTFDIAEDGPDSTKVEFTRGFNDGTFLERTIFRSKYRRSLQDLCDITTKNLRDACDRMARGEDDGLTRSS